MTWSSDWEIINCSRAYYYSIYRGNLDVKRVISLEDLCKWDEGDSSSPEDKLLREADVAVGLDGNKLSWANTRKMICLEKNRVLRLSRTSLNFNPVLFFPIHSTDNQKDCCNPIRSLQNWGMVIEREDQVKKQVNFFTSTRAIPWATVNRKGRSSSSKRKRERWLAA